MARSLQARVAARGYPVFDASGQSGQGHLPDSTRPGMPSAAAGLPSATWRDPNADPASQVTGLAAPEPFVTGGLWGLPGSPNPDRTPRGTGFYDPDGTLPGGYSKAAPLADPTAPIGEYYAEADATHAFSEGGPENRNPAYGKAVGTVTGMRLDHVRAEGGSESGQQPMYKQPMSALGGLDAVQGFGGGADGPGGVNASMPLITDQRNYPGNGYAGDSYVDPDEVPFLSVAALQPVFSDPGRNLTPGGQYDAPTASVLAQQVAPADVPDAGPSPVTSVPAYITSFWS